MLGAEAGPLGEQVQYQIVEAEGHRDVIRRAGVLVARLAGEAGDVAGPVLAGAEEERADDDARRAALDTLRISRRNRRLGDLHVRRLDDVVQRLEPPREQRRDLFEHPIALPPPRPVIDNDDSVLHVCPNTSRPPNTGQNPK